MCSAHREFVFPSSIEIELILLINVHMLYLNCSDRCVFY